MAVDVIIPWSPDHTPSEMLETAKVSVKNQSIPANIIVIKDTEQQGPSWARNRGLEKSTNRYVAFIDADDVWKPMKLTRQLNEMEKSRSGLCVEGKNQTKKEFISGILSGDIRGRTSSMLIDTEQVDARFEESLPRMEDHLFMIEAAQQAGVCFCQDLVKIRKHEQGMTARGTQDIQAESVDKLVVLLNERLPNFEDYADQFYGHFYFRQGRRNHFDGQFRQALEYYFKALQANPKPIIFVGILLTLLFAPICTLFSWSPPK